MSAERWEQIIEFARESAAGTSGNGLSLALGHRLMPTSCTPEAAQRIAEGLYDEWTIEELRLHVKNVTRGLDDHQIGFMALWVLDILEDRDDI